MLLFIGVAGNVVSSNIRQKINNLIPYLVVLVGIFFILRGLNLNIPYLSPTKDKIEKKFEKSLQDKNQISCIHSSDYQKMEACVIIVMND